jgi:hypothetical protein
MTFESGRIYPPTESSVHVWLAAQSDILTKSIARYADVYAPLLVKGGNVPSEIPICTVVGQLPLPEGFHIVPINRGKVHVFDKKGVFVRSFDHSFAMNGTNVLCPSFGQFYDYQDWTETPTKPGTRIELYRAKAPELVFGLNPGIALLTGKQDDIFNRLALVYEELA